MHSPPDSSALRPSLETLETLDARQLISCWRDIGIYGDRSCPELPTVIHCHNCPTYTHTARQLFDRPALETSRDSTHPINHQVSKPASSEVERSSLALFRMGQDWFALPAHLFQQVLTTRPIRPIPHRSNAILEGLVNIQGELLLCINLKHLLDISESAPPKNCPRLIVLEWESDRWSFFVDEFQGIEAIDPHCLIAPPSTVLTNTKTFTHSLLIWNECTVNCLDEFLLFESLERTALS